MLQTTDRQTTDDRQIDGRQHIANVNVTFANKTDVTNITVGDKNWFL